MARREVVAGLLEDRPAGRHDHEVADLVGDREQLHRPDQDVRLADTRGRVDDGLERGLPALYVVVLRHLCGERSNGIRVRLPQVEPRGDLGDRVLEEFQTAHGYVVTSVGMAASASALAGARSSRS